MTSTPPAPARRPSPRLPVWIGDGLVDEHDAMVSALDVGLRSGWGVFETFRARGEATLAAPLHLERLGAGALRLGIPFDGARVARAVQDTLEAPRPVHEVVVRVTLTAGTLDGSAGWPPEPSGRPTLVVTLHEAPQLPMRPAHAITSGARRWPADVKTTSYIASLLASREARAAGAEIAVLVDGDELLETAEGNLFAVIDGTLLTPPDDGRLLAGVTRRILLEAAALRSIPTRTAALRRSDVPQVEALAVSSSVSGLRTILSLDGVAPRPLGPSRAPAEDAERSEAREHPMVVALREQLMARWP